MIEMCNCIEALNEKLKESDACVSSGFQFKDGEAQTIEPFIAIERIKKGSRKKLPTVLCNYCPICGEKK